ncbi:DUF1307 domain-containing protein [Oceanobacillus oncorhynchi subsp. incaldanensis]|uniref:DUF1307 domain-containing protein n=1 Tax=Oceanobacillus TaxID=182709 RepID=UPI001B1C6CF3|nr:DUF1307 domain-containing protein [Oceanobacillus oncorhynchi]GIO20841.1 DUF1307 domain-containing protein [Oceanobacillus oncorhynchi subsp. incaldanensis]
MKKRIFRITGLLFLFIAIAGLMACGKEETVTLQGEQMGMTMEVTMDAKDDEMTKQTVKANIPYSMVGAASQEEAESMDELFRSEFEPFEDIDGIEFDLDYGEEELTQTISVDLTVADIEEINSIPGASFPDTGDDEYISLEETVSDFEEQGFEVVEE